MCFCHILKLITHTQKKKKKEVATLSWTEGVLTFPEQSTTGKGLNINYTSKYIYIYMEQTHLDMAI